MMLSSRLSKLILAVLVAMLLGETTAMRKQGVAIKGRFLCGNVPPNSTKVRIVDVDSGPDPDDTLEEKMVSPNGEFSLNGYTRELTPIDPILYVWSDCNAGGTPCHRKMKFTIPKKFIISEEPKHTEWIDLGIINLQSNFEAEKRDCIY